MNLYVAAMVAAFVTLIICVPASLWYANINEKKCAKIKDSHTQAGLESLVVLVTEMRESFNAMELEGRLVRLETWRWVSMEMDHFLRNLSMTLPTFLSPEYRESYTVFLARSLGAAKRSVQQSQENSSLGREL